MGEALRGATDLVMPDRPSLLRLFLPIRLFAAVQEEQEWGGGAGVMRWRGRPKAQWLPAKRRRREAEEEREEVKEQHKQREEEQEKEEH